MNSKMLQTSAAVLSLAVLTSACENLSPGENAAVFGTAAGLATAIPLGVAGVDSSITVPVSLGAAALAAGGAYIIAKQQAKEKKAAQTAATASKKKKSRYIAVKTVKEENSKGASQVMIFDTQSNQVVGNNVYDLKASPKVGQTSKFDTYTAEYVGG